MSLSRGQQAGGGAEELREDVDHFPAKPDGVPVHVSGEFEGLREGGHDYSAAIRKTGTEGATGWP